MTEIYYDPYDFEIDAEPHRVWRRMRDEAPLYRNDTYEFWALSRYEDVSRALVDCATYSSARGTLLEFIKADLEVPPGSIIFEDPPAHDVHRGLLSRVFTPRRVNGLDPKVREFCAQRLDPRRAQQREGQEGKAASLAYNLTERCDVAHARHRTLQDRIACALRDGERAMLVERAGVLRGSEMNGHCLLDRTQHSAHGAMLSGQAGREGCILTHQHEGARREPANTAPHCISPTGWQVDLVSPSPARVRLGPVRCARHGHGLAQAHLVGVAACR